MNLAQAKITAVDTCDRGEFHRYRHSSKVPHLELDMIEWVSSRQTQQHAATVKLSRNVRLPGGLIPGVVSHATDLVSTWNWSPIVSSRLMNSPAEKTS
jgi:hypothetical protein